MSARNAMSVRLVFLLILCLPLTLATSVFAQGTEADVAINQAILAYDEHRYEEARHLLDGALAVDPNNVEALYYAGLVAIADQRPADAVRFLERARSLSPADRGIQYQPGVTYFALENYDEADPLLTFVFKEAPTTEGVGYYVGFLRYRRKDYQGALEAFRAAASTDPRIKQLTRYYAGLTLAILGLPDQAAKELEEIQRIRTVSPLTGPADRLRDTITVARERERRLHGELRVGAYYDTNVAVNPLSSNDPTVIQLRSRRANSPGELAAARLEYAWLRRGPWEATVTYSFFQTVNNRLTAFNVEDHLGGATVNYRGLIRSMPFQISAQYAFDTLSLNFDRFLDRHTGLLTATLIENAGNLTQILGRVQVKDFSSLFLIGAGNIPTENRDATNWMAGLSHMFRFQNDRHLIQLGYQWDTDDAKGPDWAYHGHRFLVGSQYTLPWQDLRLKYNFDLYLRRYPALNSIFPVTAPGTVRQNVVEQNHVVRVEYPLPMNLTLAGDFQATISRSSLPVLFNYDRFIWTGSLSWAF
jgi:tetratricopeptide (TPR) repeat protein